MVHGIFCSGRMVAAAPGWSGDVEDEAEASAASDSSSSIEKEPQMEFDTQSKEAQEAWAETRY